MYVAPDGLEGMLTTISSRFTGVLPLFVIDSVIELVPPPVVQIGLPTKELRITLLVGGEMGLRVTG
jgi:hypothetical protein